MIYLYLGDSLPMQQLIRPFDGTDPTYSTEDSLNAITASMVMTAGTEQIESPYNRAWNLKRIALIQTALISPAQQWYSYLPLEIKKNWQAFCQAFQRHLITDNRKYKRNFFRKDNLCFGRTD